MKTTNFLSAYSAEEKQGLLGEYNPKMDKNLVEQRNITESISMLGHKAVTRRALLNIQFI